MAFSFKWTGTYFSNWHRINLKRGIFLFLHFLLPALISCNGENSNVHSTPNSPEPWHQDYNIDVDKVEFSQYMTVYNSEEREIILDRIAHKQEPQYAVYRKLLTEADQQSDFLPSRPETLHIMGGYEANSNLSDIREILWKNAFAAYTCALAWDLTNNEGYAEKATGILMAWADAGTTFTGSDRGLQLGSYFNPMLYAADLLDHYSGWKIDDRVKFESWWREEVLGNGSVVQTMRIKDNNWKDAGLLGVITAAVVFKDKDLLKEALIQQRSYFHPRTDSSVRIKGDGWKFAKNEKGEYLPREVVRNNGRSGLTYTAYALTTMVQHFEIARYCGFNNWHNTAPNGATLHGIIDQFFLWEINGDPFFWHSNPGKKSTRKNSYEIANNHFKLRTDMRDWIINNRPLNGEQGDPWVTLTKGDIK
jgi:hypothetical protein